MHRAQTRRTGSIVATGSVSRTPPTTSSGRCRIARSESTEETLNLGYAGVHPSSLRHAEAASTRHDIDVRTKPHEGWQAQPVGRMDGMIIAIAIHVAAAQNRSWARGARESPLPGAHLGTPLATGERHFFFVGWILSEKVSSDPLLRFSARFSLMDLPDFLDMLCRGDLSLMGESL